MILFLRFALPQMKSFQIQIVHFPLYGKISFVKNDDNMSGNLRLFLG